MFVLDIGISTKHGYDNNNPKPFLLEMNRSK